MVKYGLLCALSLLSATGCNRPAPDAPEPVRDDAGSDEEAYGWAECPDGRTDAGFECGMPAAPCRPGTAFFVGDDACTAVGPAGCPAGFEPHASGFGCRPVAPTGTCTGATFEQLGNTSCVPLDDCSTPFPPAGATIFVDGRYTAGQIDATHKRLIADAIAAAPSGAIIAIEAGDYAEALAPTRPVTLAGRCAEQVVLRGTSAQTGVTADATKDLTVSGMTITGFEPAVFLSGGATLTLDHVLLEQNTKGGVLASGAGTRITVRRSAIRGNLPDASGRFGHGIAVGFGAEAVVEGSALTDNGESGVFAQSQAKATVNRSIVRRSRQRSGNGAYGWGIGAQSGGALVVSESAISDVAAGAVVAVQEGSTAQVSFVFAEAIRAGPTADGSQQGSALVVQQGATATVTDCTLTDADSAGLLVGIGGTATVERSAILGVRTSSLGMEGLVVASGARVTARNIVVADNAQVGVIVSDTGELQGDGLFLLNNTGAALAVSGKATLTRVRATATRDGRSPGSLFGAGAFIGAGGLLELDRAVIEQSPGLGVLVSGTNAGVILRRSVVRETRALGDISGFGVTVAHGAWATVERSALVGNSDISLQIQDPQSTASVVDTTIARTLPNGPEGRGRGVNVQDKATLQLARVAVSQSTQVGVNVVSGAEALIEDCRIDGSARSVNGFGHGLTVTDLGGVTLRRSTVKNAQGVGLVFASGAGAVISGCAIASNAVGIHTRSDATLVEAASEPLNGVEGGRVVLTQDTQFRDNQTNVGSGTIALPAAVERY